MTEIADALRDTLLDLARIPSPIGEEAELCNHVEARLSRSLGAEAISRFHDSLIVRAARRQNASRIALVGHLDTVRTEHDGPARVEENRLYGAGASGLAIMIELVERLDLAALPCDLTLIFYEREEGPFEENRLGPILDAYPALHELDLAICLEPSDNEMQLGAMGTLHATLTFLGRTAHSARPWQGDNALYKAAKFLTKLEQREPHDVELDGHLFREVLRELVGDECEVEGTDLAPAGRPHADNPYVQHLATCGVSGVRTKQAWTDVARFDAIGVPGVNLGPGAAAQAHQPNEYTELDQLEDGYAIFERFFTKKEDSPLY
jgi:succinyl-diaminopimelate desuccinylase